MKSLNKAMAKLLKNYPPKQKVEHAALGTQSRRDLL